MKIIWRSLFIFIVSFVVCRPPLKQILMGVLLGGLFMFGAIAFPAEAQHEMHNSCIQLNHLSSVETESVLNVLKTDPNLLLMDSSHNKGEILQVETVRMEDIHLFHAAFNVIEQVYGKISAPPKIFEVHGFIAPNVRKTDCSNFPNSCLICNDDGTWCLDCFSGGGGMICAEFRS